MEYFCSREFPKQFWSWTRYVKSVQGFLARGSKYFWESWQGPVWVGRYLFPVAAEMEFSSLHLWGWTIGKGSSPRAGWSTGTVIVNTDCFRWCLSSRKPVDALFRLNNVMSLLLIFKFKLLKTWKIFPFNATELYSLGAEISQ